MRKAVGCLLTISTLYTMDAVDCHPGTTESSLSSSQMQFFLNTQEQIIPLYRGIAKTQRQHSALYYGMCLHVAQLE